MGFENLRGGGVLFLRIWSHSGHIHLVRLEQNNNNFVLKKECKCE